MHFCDFILVSAILLNAFFNTFKGLNCHPWEHYDIILGDLILLNLLIVAEVHAVNKKHQEYFFVISGLFERFLEGTFSKRFVKKGTNVSSSSRVMLNIQSYSVNSFQVVFAKPRSAAEVMEYLANMFIKSHISPKRFASFPSPVLSATSSTTRCETLIIRC